MRKNLIVSVLLAAFLCATVLADDIVPPVWRGEENTTMQAWEFFDDQNPDPPDMVDNPYGEPYAQIDNGGSPWWLPTHMGENGVWMVENDMTLYIPNYQVPNPLKLIYIQMTYQPGALQYDPVIRIDYGQEYVYADPTQTQELGEFYHSVWEARIQPNPESEWITIKPAFCKVYVSEVVVDTQCIPEPATICLLGLGSLLFLRRRKR